MKRNNQCERGITLIALIITIIVLVILTAVSIKRVVGGEWIIERASAAAKNYTNESYKEVKEQNIVDNIVKEIKIKINN